MSVEVKIYDYIDGSGQNLISTWIDGIGVKPRAKFNQILYNLQEKPANEWHKSPAVKKLKHQADLWEIIAVSDKVQWRLFGVFGPGEGTFTLLAGASKKGNKLNPANTLNTAQQRKVDVRNSPQKYRRHHAF
jgi:hypothetical protein